MTHPLKRLARRAGMGKLLAQVNSVSRVGVRRSVRVRSIRRELLPKIIQAKPLPGGEVPGGEGDTELLGRIPSELTAERVVVLGRG